MKKVILVTFYFLSFFSNAHQVLANEISVEFDDMILIPNVFSPNGDGTNDLFKPTGNISELSIQIYNRWGELLYETNQVNAGWDGRTYSGAKCSEGTYFYIIKLNGETYNGHLTLVR